jgi:hypothetical protein
LIKAIKITVMTPFGLEEQCELGQRQLMETQYLAAIQTLVVAEELAWEAKDYSILSRLYMPLQEARRQARQRCGEGTVSLALSAAGPDDALEPEAILDAIPHGQLLVAGWGSIEPALRLRELSMQRKLYVESFLAAVFPIIGGASAIIVVPLEDVRLPDAEPRSIDELIKLLPAHCLVFGSAELPQGNIHGSSETFARVSEMWERLHQPFLAAADMEINPVAKMAGYRKTIRVDSACEFAHQRLAAVAKQLCVSA